MKLSLVVYLLFIFLYLFVVFPVQYFYAPDFDFPDTFVGNELFNLSLSAFYVLVHLPLLVGLYFIHKKIIKQPLESGEKLSFRFFPLAVLAIVTVYFANSGIFSLVAGEESIRSSASYRSWHYSEILLLGVLGPLFEEIIFRRMMLDHFRQHFTPVQNTILVSFLFSFYHTTPFLLFLDGFGFSDIYTVQSLLTFVLSVILCVSYLVNRSFWLVFILHSLYNSIFIVGGGGIGGAKFQMLAILVLLVFFFIYFRKPEWILSRLQSVFLNPKR